MIIQGSHAPCSIPYHTFFPYRMLIGKLMDPLNKQYVRTHSSLLKMVLALLLSLYHVY